MKIERIDDLLPALAGHDEFIIRHNPDYSYIDYQFLLPDSFDDDRRKECRGIKFHVDGRIMSRPFAKFFNLGEKEQPEDVNWRRLHHVLDKLDGSMIHSAKLADGRYVLMTRAGFSDQAKHAQSLFFGPDCDIDYVTFCAHCEDFGITPIFEYTGPENRIVVRYETPALTLIGARDKISGKHLDAQEMVLMAKSFGIPLVGGYGQSVEDFREFMARVKALEGKEGYVIHFDGGHLLKIKSDEYLTKHRAKSDLDSKSKVLDVVLDGGVDDFAGALDDADAAELREFNTKVWEQVNGVVVGLGLIVESAFTEKLDRKTFAVNVVPALEKWQAAAAFAAYTGLSPVPAIVKAMKRDTDIVVAKWRGV